MPQANVLCCLSGAFIWFMINNAFAFIFPFLHDWCHLKEVHSLEGFNLGVLYHTLISIMIRMFKISFWPHYCMNLGGAWVTNAIMLSNKIILSCLGDNTVTYNLCATQLFFFLLSWVWLWFSSWWPCSMPAMWPSANPCITRPSRTTWSASSPSFSVTWLL